MDELFLGKLANKIAIAMVHGYPRRLIWGHDAWKQPVSVSVPRIFFSRKSTREQNYQKIFARRLMPPKMGHLMIPGWCQRMTGWKITIFNRKYTSSFIVDFPFSHVRPPTTNMEHMEPNKSWFFLSKKWDFKVNHVSFQGCSFPAGTLW